MYPPTHVSFEKKIVMLCKLKFQYETVTEFVRDKF